MTMTDVAKLRLFVAIEPPEAVRVVLAQLPARIRGVNWTTPHQYHLTLRYIGDVAEERLAAIEKALARIRVESFLLPLTGAGSFPPRRPPRVIWVGVGSGHPRLFQLRQKIDDALLHCGLDLEIRDFHPHFTLGRCARDTKPASVAQFLRGLGDFGGMSTSGLGTGPLFRVEAFILFRSELTPQDPVHTPLRTFALPLNEGAP